uniref:Uncharacterized protein n=1 Tax=Anguilla anguilla TaxID=7936 RepID=A0A0E9QIK2_ANGAN
MHNSFSVLTLPNHMYLNWPLYLINLVLLELLLKCISWFPPVLPLIKLVSSAASNCLIWIFIIIVAKTPSPISY